MDSISDYLPVLELKRNRECTGDSIAYKSIKLYHKTSGTPNDMTIRINESSYVYKFLTAFTESSISLSYQKQIDELIINEPEIPPLDLLLFKIWQFEYIEKGLREY